MERYATLALAKALLEKNIEAFERENQPALVAEASRLFSQMTGGRYVRIRATGRRELFVERKDGSRASPDELSTGTSEQLFFSLRLAYVSLYAERAEPLPVVLDDVLVNFDRERALATLRAIATVANRFQVLFFTCHDYLADLVSEAIPTARILDLAPQSSERSSLRQAPYVSESRRLKSRADGTKIAPDGVRRWYRLHARRLRATKQATCVPSRAGPEETRWKSSSSSNSASSW